MQSNNDDGFEVREVYFDDEGSGPECAYVYLAYRHDRESLVSDAATDDRR